MPGGRLAFIGPRDSYKRQRRPACQFASDWTEDQLRLNCSVSTDYTEWAQNTQKLRNCFLDFC